jgi:hypothetical protein
MSDQASELKQMQQAIEDLKAQVVQLQQARQEQEASRATKGTASDFSSKLERLNYYRREDTQEWTLLTNRVNSYITSQAFLVSGFAASMANPDLRFRLCFPVILSTIGIIASVRAYPGIDGACKIIQLWHDKKTKLLEDPCLADFCDGRAEVVPETLYRRLIVHLTSRSKIGRRGHYGKTSPVGCEAGSEPEAGERVDEIHITSLYFAQVAPKLFGGAWVVLLILALVLHFVH